MTRHHHDDDEDRPRSRRVVRDGESVRVSMFAMDADPVQRAIAQARLHDGQGNAPGHKPGFAMSDANDANAARDKAYRLYDEQVSNAWRSGGAEGREGTTCTCKNGEFSEYFGAPGHIVDSVCTPDELIDDGQLLDMQPLRENLTIDQLEREHQQRVGRAYQAYDEKLRNTWRMP